ncbi:MAG TPA: proton-conducting transporter membrane subunit [Rubrivivax sp.]|nr:proton-conducting transporter membrane subunit [Rubrivivax sp.]
MATDFVYGLLPAHLLLALMVALMLLETLRADTLWARPVFVAGLLASGTALLHQWQAGYSAEIVAGEVRVDRLAILGTWVLLGCGLSLPLVFAARQGYKFWMLVTAMLLGGTLVLQSAGFASLFLGIELLSLPAFALIVQDQGCTGPASEGAFKYLVLSSVASALLLFGVSLAYGVTGTLSISAFVQALGGGGAQASAAALLVMSGLFLKAAVFPFHAWAPDAYAGARMQVTALMASLVKAAVVLALVRILQGAVLDAATARLVGALAIVSIVFGNLAALGQTRFKRLLAYSSVAHAGYMIFALTDITGNRADDLLWYTAFYAGATLLACASFAVICPGEDDSLQALDGQFARHPVAAVLLAVAVLSLAGLPPLPGFFAKLLVFKSVVASGHLLAAILAFVGSFLGLAVYLGMVMRLFRTDLQRPLAGST